MSVTVIKVGGSLLSMPDLAARLERLIDSLVSQQILLVVGGGPAADVVRDWDHVHRLSSEASHWLAIDALSLTSRLLQRLVAKTALARTQADVVEAWSASCVPILEPRPWIEFFEHQHGVELARDWSVTTDSIAAWLAACWPAQELILAKSVPVPLDESSDAVDEFFPRLIHRLPSIRWINLRDDTAQPLSWRPKT